MTKPNNTDLLTLLGITDLPPGDQAAYVQKFCTIFLDAALEELVTTLKKEEITILENYLDIGPTPAQLVTHLQNEHPTFQVIIKKYITALQQ